MPALDYALDTLAKQTMDFLSQEGKASGLSEGDKIQNFLWDDLKEPVPVPPMWELYQRLKLYVMRDALGGQSGTLPFLERGGFLDQPYINSLALELCARIERNYISQDLRITTPLPETPVF